MIKKRNLLWLLVAAMAIVSVGCTQEPAAGDGNAPSGKIKLAATFENVQDEGATKVNFSTSSGAFTWTEGDQIAVHTSTPNWQTATLESGSGLASGVFTAEMNETDRDGYAIYPASVAGGSAAAPAITLPSSYTIDGSMGTFSPLPMIAVNAPSTALAFKHVGGIFRITLNKVPKDTKSIVVTMDKQITGTFTVNVSDASKPTITTTGAASSNTVTFNFPTQIAAETDNVVLNVPVPVGLYTSLRVDAYSAVDGGGSHLSGASNDTVRDILRSYGKKVVDFYPDWTVSGEFSVSASQKVYFAKGNLIARLGSSEMGQDPLRFYLAANQWDYVYDKTTGGYNSGNTSLDTDRDYDLFCWSADGSSYKWGIATGNVSDYYDIHYNSISYFPGSFRDWGNNTIYADATSTTVYSGSWRTLTKEEWDYLTYTRTTTNNYRFLRAKVHSINGVIIFPDNYDASNIKTFSNVNVTNTAWASVPSVSDSEWTAMEEGGCVFLPCAGCRRGSGSLIEGSTSGYYWSSTPDGDRYADCYIISPEGMNFYQKSEYRCFGLSVRLVQNK